MVGKNITPAFIILFLVLMSVGSVIALDPLDWLSLNNTFLKLTGGNITGNLNVTGNFTGDNIYGSFNNWTQSGFIATPSASAVYNNFTGLKANLTNGVYMIKRTNTQGGDAIKVLVPGVYKITGKVAMTIATGGEYGFGIVVNGVNPEVNGDCYSQIDGKGVKETTSMACMYRLIPSDNVTFVYDDEANPVRALTVYKIELELLRIGN